MAQARLDVKVTGDSSGALRAINAVRAAGDEFANKFREQSKKAVGQIVHMINPVILAATAIVAGVAKIGASIREHFEDGREKAKKAGEALQAVSKELGVSADAYQTVRTQAQLAGKSVEDFNAEMAKVKEGKITVDELAQSFGNLTTTAAGAKASVKQVSLEVAAERMAREKAAEEAEENMSAVSDDDRLEAWARVQIARGMSLEQVREEVMATNRNRSFWRRMNYREQNEMLARLTTYYEANNPEVQAARAEAARQQREQEANAAAWAQAEREATERSRAITAAGGVLNWAVGQVSAQTGSLVGADDARVRELVSRYGRWYERTRGRFQSAEEFSRQFVDAQSRAQKEADEKRKADEKRQKEASDRKAKEEERQGKIADVKEWARLAREEAQGSYRGGYDNAFGLMAGAGDLIGAGRYRAVTRMTEAAKLLKVNEQVLEINKQMNEKLKALEEG